MICTKLQTNLHHRRNAQFQLPQAQMSKSPYKQRVSAVPTYTIIPTVAMATSSSENQCAWATNPQEQSQQSDQQ